MNIAIIPARAGSKSIINKNLVGIKNGVSITEEAINKALKSKLFHKTILTTDIPILIDKYQMDMNVVTRERPERLCTDDALMKDVVLDVLKTYSVPDNFWVWLLQPTSPFREVFDFKNIQTAIEKLGIDSVISVNECGPDHPNRCYSKKGSTLFPLRYTNFNNKQDLMELFIRNGAFYVTKAGLFRETESFYNKPCYGYEMNNKGSINIDGPIDLEMAKIAHSQPWLFK